MSTSANRASGAERIAAERQRQIDQEGWTPEHDADHGHELIFAAIAYALAAAETPCSPPDGASCWWPWEGSSWKPTDPIRNLEKAGALIAAEIDRLLNG